MLKTTLTIITLSLLGTACHNTPASNESVDSLTTANQSKATQNANESDCPVLDSRKWGAWVNKMPGPEVGARLNVVGEIDLPSEGYELKVTLGPADRRNPPAQRIFIELTPPTGSTKRNVTTKQVEFRTETTITNYRAIIVGCGDELLAEITDIQAVY